MTASIFRWQHRVTYAECAPGNHVYYARYLDFLEAARGELFRQVGQPMLSWEEQKIMFPVSECHIRYKSSARYDDLLNIEVWLTALERVRLGFAHRIINSSGQEILQAATIHACASLDGKLQRLPEVLKKSLTPFLHESPDAKV